MKERVDGSKIRQLREARKAMTGGKQGSQTWLAQEIGAHFTSISDWERGANQPSARHLRSIARVFGVSVEDLYERDEDDDESATVAPLTREATLNALRPLAALLQQAGVTSP